MIRLLETLPPITEPFVGCEMQTLFECYKADWQRLSVFGCKKAVLVKFGGRLLVSGIVDFASLLEFAAMMQISQIEGLAEYLPTVGENQSFHSVMQAQGTNFTSSKQIAKNDKMYTAFELIRRSDAQFFSTMPYLDYLSAARSRINHDLGNVYLLESLATAAVWGQTPTHALIGYVAVAPEARGQGLGRQIVQHIAAEVLQSGRTPFLFSLDAKTDTFYQRCGFVPVGRKTIIKLQ